MSMPEFQLATAGTLKALIAWLNSQNNLSKHNKLNSILQYATRQLIQTNYIKHGR